jgi:hypothetical protein
MQVSARTGAAPVGLITNTCGAARFGRYERGRNHWRAAMPPSSVTGQGATVVKNTSVGLVGALTAVLKNGMKVDPALVRPS